MKRHTMFIECKIQQANMPILLKLVGTLDTISIKIPAAFLVDRDKIILSISCQWRKIHKGMRPAKTSLYKKNKVRGSILADIKTSIAKVIKTV